jgi:ppGpp synthetase/RelA/SpoT-type nucleotidyltranferase
MPKSLKTIEGRKQLLIQRHFPWNQDGFLAKPAGSDPAAQERAVMQWLEHRTLSFGAAALALAARIHPILRELEAPVSPGRLLARIDCSSHVKSPASILEKMVRAWGAEQHPAIGFHNLHEEMSDLGRFRIVANFLSDAVRIARALEEPYDALASGRLTVAQRQLRAEYSLKENHLVDLIHLDSSHRKSGERCLKGLFRPRVHERLAVEVQVQTLLQEAWDKKDHSLIYERRRRGEVVEPQHQREIFAMSEMLWVADLTFDRLRAEIVDGGSAPRRRKAPNGGARGVGNALT